MHCRLRSASSTVQSNRTPDQKGLSHMRLQASKGRLWLVVFALIAATVASAQTTSSPPSSRASSMLRGVEGYRELSAVVAIPAATGSTESSLPDAPSAAAVAPAAQSTPTTADEGTQRPPKPSSNEPLGIPFLAANGMLLGSTIADAEMIARCRPSACQAVPDSIRSRPALYGIGIPSSLAVSYIAYRIKRGGSRWWIVPVAVLTVGNVVYAAHAAQWSR
jgi:hypothetical protein